MKKVAALLALALASVVAVAACSSKSDSGASTTTTATSAATAAPMNTMSNVAIDPGETAAPKSSLPIPLSKLPSLKVAAGSVANGAKLFAANCESCHGAGGKNGQVGPTLAGTGIKAGQVAYMVRNPAAIDKESSMPKLTITDKELADIAAYVASLK
ncbi:MAG TPA: cytochrome c [Candidatus Eremiobacteraceae bacterium]|nr:cytochrome c [Candidatus Eremiobacteraceae bacterium]